MTPLEFGQDFQHQNIRVSGLSCGVVCVILHLAVSVERQLVTDGWTDTRRHLILAIAGVAEVETHLKGLEDYFEGYESSEMSLFD